MIFQENILRLGDIDGLFRFKKDPSVVWARCGGIAEINKLRSPSMVLCAVIADDDQWATQGTYNESGQLGWFNELESVEKVEWVAHPSFKVL